MPPIFNLQRLILASMAFAIMVIASSNASADPIVITTGNPGNQNTITSFTDIKQWRLGGLAPAGEVPEPASLLLLGSGLVGTAGAIRRRLRNRKEAQDQTSETGD